MIHSTAPEGFAELGAKDNNDVTENDQVSHQGADAKSILKFCTVERESIPDKPTSRNQRYITTHPELDRKTAADAIVSAAVF